MKRFLKTVLPAVGMLLLILEPKFAVSSAREALELCLKSVVPSLFPFFVLSALLSSSLIGAQNRATSLLGRLCGMPPGTESIFLIGLLGGYPTGAQITAQAFRDGAISKDQARRMLGFCSNAGPAFLFGICGSLFPAGWMAWLLWGIHGISAVLTARSLEKVDYQPKILPAGAEISLPAALDRSLRNMARVCGWVILFRLLTGFLEHWLIDLPDIISVLISGMLELTNGCLVLDNVASIGLRFYLCSLFLAFGGLCVTMQTVSVAGDLGIGHYLHGKLLQTSVSGLLSLAVVILFFPGARKTEDFLAFALLVVHLFAYILLKRKKTVAIRKEMMYNQEKQESWT